jgi:hypothetical protein
MYHYPVTPNLGRTVDSIKWRKSENTYDAGFLMLDLGINRCNFDAWEVGHELPYQMPVKTDCI